MSQLLTVTPVRARKRFSIACFWLPFTGVEVTAEEYSTCYEVYRINKIQN
jgi:hypothetical protein